MVPDVRSGPHALLDAVLHKGRSLDERRGQPRGRQQLGSRQPQPLRQGQRRHGRAVRAGASAVPDEARGREGRGEVRALHVGRGHGRHRRQAARAEGAVRRQVLRRAVPAVLRGARHDGPPFPERAWQPELYAQRHLQLAAHVQPPRHHRRSGPCPGHRHGSGTARQDEAFGGVGLQQRELGHQPRQSVCAAQRHREGPQGHRHPSHAGRVGGEGRHLGAGASRHGRRAGHGHPERHHRRGPVRPRLR